MSKKYVARDPRTGRSIGVSERSKRSNVGISGLSPDPGPWQMLPLTEIVSLAKGDITKIEVPAESGNWNLGRIDAIKALHKVLERDADYAYEALVDALDDDYPDVRIAGLKSLPSFTLRRQGILFQCLSDRLQDDNEDVREEARNCLRKVVPVFPSGCEGILRRELRDGRKEHRDNAFQSLQLASKYWPEVGCLHLDELIREDDDDLRVRGSAILRTIAAKGGAQAWDLISWSMQDEEVRVRRNSSKALTILAGVEPKIAAIMVESSMEEQDRAIRTSVIRALKKLDMQSPRVSRMIMRGAQDKAVEMRRACIGQLTVLMTGQELREAAADLLRKESDPELRKKLSALARDPDFEGSEEERNKALAPLDEVEAEDPIPHPPPPLTLREDDKQKSGRPASED